jgi:predicted transcriptional regulator
MEEFLLGDRELDVMAVLWEVESGTVAEVRKKLPADLAYTTVLTILRNLEDKGFVSHEAEGRAFRYFPRLGRQAAQRNVLSKLIDKLFHGSPEQLIAHLAEDHEITAKDLQRLRKKISTRPDKSEKPDKRGKR